MQQDSSNPLGGMFGPEQMARLMTNPKTAAYFQDPKFRTLFEMCKQNPQMLTQVMQMDPRFQDILGVMLGVDLTQMKEDNMRQKDNDADSRKRFEEEEKARQAEEERRRKEEEERNLPDDKRKEVERKKLAEQKKNEGNTAYKNKNFEQALQLYDEAIQHNDSEITYYTNKAAVYFEMKDYQKCIEECDRAIQKSHEGYYDYVKLSKALGRKGNALLAMGEYDQAIDMYQKALLENNDN